MNEYDQELVIPPKTKKNDLSVATIESAYIHGVAMNKSAETIKSGLQDVAGGGFAVARAIKEAAEIKKAGLDNISGSIDYHADMNHLLGVKQIFFEFVEIMHKDIANVVMSYGDNIDKQSLLNEIPKIKGVLEQWYGNTINKVDKNDFEKIYIQLLGRIKTNLLQLLEENYPHYTPDFPYDGGQWSYELVDSFIPPFWDIATDIMELHDGSRSWVNRDFVFYLFKFTHFFIHKMDIDEYAVMWELYEYIHKYICYYVNCPGLTECDCISYAISKYYHY